MVHLSPSYTHSMIYEKIGSYLLRSLVSLYADDELAFVRKCEAIY